MQVWNGQRMGAKMASIIETDRNGRTRELCCYNEYGSHHYFPIDCIWKPDTPDWLRKFDAHRGGAWVSAAFFSAIICVVVSMCVDAKNISSLWFLLVMLGAAPSFIREILVLRYKTMNVICDDFDQLHKRYMRLPDYARERLQPLYVRLLGQAQISNTLDVADTTKFTAAMARVESHQNYLKEHTIDPAHEAAQNLIELCNEERKAIESA